MKAKNVSSRTLALLLFVTIFGITNISSNYANLDNSAISWFILLGLYFIPLALVMAELASFNSDSNSGMSGWIKLGLGEKWAFIGSWSYFIANIFYLPMIASRIPVMLSWTFTAKFDSLDEVVQSNGQIPGVIQASTNQTEFLIIAFIMLIIALIAGIYFEKLFNALGKYIGILSLAITGLFIVLGLLSVPILHTSIAHPLTYENTMPSFTVTSLSTFAWILFAITGIETVGSYVGRIEDSQKKVSKGIFLAAFFIIIAYILGFVAMSFILTPAQVPIDHMENMWQIMYAQVGSLWGFGPLYLRIIMFIYAIITITSVVLWMISTVSVLFEELPEGVLSEKIQEKKINGIPIIGLIFLFFMLLIFIIISNSTINSDIYTTLYNMSTTAVLVPYLLVLLSYIVFKRKGFSTSFQMNKNKTISQIIAIFLFIITTLAIVFSSYDLGITDINERINWLCISAGGLIFFLSIGVGIYLIKVNKKCSFLLEILIFLLGGYFFANILYYVAFIIFVFLMLYMWEEIKNKSKK